ncbi:mycofactocin biosynthesis chaperone MftB [Acidiferrimicrobium sp. IK]|uniref:mycofactocin biosynthesis chaperone MftB n=1 Tax=Acidiferrimicrobium sp. IK TaxID=2871700 RepID=UPI0021CAE59B|nr:mycofactocin biosynthesis chaperone MftB [Acidiferrimicrobium sp. IK]MCU4184284.1 mycofactocin biosynthesis chaperone MftB [Acidiferrimicrobium sp. IK]
MRGVLIPPGTAAGEVRGDLRYRMDPQVALRPERFGALAYHYGNRRLNFLRSPLLATVVETLDEYPSLQASLDALVPAAQHDTYRRALSALATSQFIQPSPEEDRGQRTDD